MGSFGPRHSLGGKRLRPLLTLLCHGSCDSNLERALLGAVAVELLHNFTLIHDDIEDNSPLRHNRPTLWRKWGLAQAINAGDALFSLAQTAILSLEETCGLEVTLNAARQMNAVCLHLTRGQYLDIAFETAPVVTVETYLDMVAGKTAALIAFAASLGGLTSKQNFSVLERLSDYGKMLGLAFQIQDDLLGIWGDPNVTGKSAASDLQTHKKSTAVLYGLAQSSEFLSAWSIEKPTDSEFKSCPPCGELRRPRLRHPDRKTITDQAFQALNELFPQRNLYSDALHELTGHVIEPLCLSNLPFRP